MNAVVEAVDLIQAAAGPPAGYESVKAGIRRAAHAVGIEPGLAKRLWYGEVRRVDAELMDRLRRAADARTRGRERKRALSMERFSPGSPPAKRPFAFRSRTWIARTIMGFAAWLAVLIAPWIKDAER